jgi:hypothetical protein
VSTAAVELTVMHRGGTRRGDVVLATVAEYHALEAYRAMEVRLLIRARDEGRCVNGHLIAEVGVHKSRDGWTCADVA